MYCKFKNIYEGKCLKDIIEYEDAVYHRYGGPNNFNSENNNAK